MAVVKTNASSVYFTNTSNSKNGIKRERLSFSNLDASLIIFSMVTVLIDHLTDIILVVTYYLAGHTFWSISTIALAVIPAIIIQGFSIRWHILDEAASVSKWLSHCCLLGIYFRYVDVLQTGLEARRSGDVADFQHLFHKQSDICMLQLFESFMESAPQLVLQLYIMIQSRDWELWTGISTGASMVSLAWAIAAYTRAMRQARPDKQKASCSGLFLQAVWRAGLLAARITALVLFAICCQAWLFLLLGLHWLGMTVWVVLQKTDLCSTPWEECAYNGVVGIVYCFCFFNLREGRARGRMLAFYVVTVTQNLACLYLFLALAQHSHPIVATMGAGTVIGGTIVGLSALLLYYRFFHPSGPIALFGPPIVPSPIDSLSVQCAARRSQQPSPNQLPCPIPVQKEVGLQDQLQMLAQASHMPSEIEKTNSMRSLKHLWSADRDGSLSSRSDDVPGHSGSPQADRHLLVSSRRAVISQLNHSSQSSNTSQSTVSVHSVHLTQASVLTVRPVFTSESETQAKGTPPAENDDSKLSWNCTSMMEETQHSEVIDCPVPEADIGGGLNKRRGICSSVELGLDKLEDNQEGKLTPPNVASKGKADDDSFARLCQKLVDKAEVKLLKSDGTISRPGNATKVATEREEKRESDYIDSKQSAISSDGTPSEVLSAHDYENICAVNIAREAWGLRSWRGYSDIETWLHDDSVVRDRRRDTLASIGTTTTLTSASSERSTTSESPPMPPQPWEPGDTLAPPLPCRRPRPLYNRMDDYLDTLAFDLAEIERRENTNNDVPQDNMFVAQPYVVDQNGMLYPLPAPLDTIHEELEESSVSTESAPGWSSSLVATIDEIRVGTTICNPLEDSVQASDSDLEVGSYRSLQLDACALHNFPCQDSPTENGASQHRFSNSLPSLLQAPRSWSHLSPEEVLFLSELKPQPDNESCNDSQIFSAQVELKPESARCGKKPRRKFSLLRERFEITGKTLRSDKKECIEPSFLKINHDVSEALNENILSEEKDVIYSRSNNAYDSTDSGIKISAVDKWSGLVEIHGKQNSSINPFKETDFKPTDWSSSNEALTFRSRNFLKQVIAPPKFVPRGKKLALASNASA